MVPTGEPLLDGNCPKEGVELVLVNSTTSIDILALNPPSSWPAAIK